MPPVPNSADMELEDRIAAMAPHEPDVLKLFDAIKILENAWKLELGIEISHASKIQMRTVLRRETESGIYFNMVVRDGKYLNACQDRADRYEVIYLNFVAAAYGFCGRVPSTRYRNF